VRFVAQEVHDPELFALEDDDGRASLVRRWFAAMLDNLLVIPAFVVISVVGVLMGRDPEVLLETQPIVWLAVGLVSVPQWILVAWRGQTLGKLLLGIRIVRMDGTLPGFQYGVAARDWPRLIPSVLAPDISAIIGLIDVLPLLSGDGRTMHDYIAGTRVVVASHPVEGAQVPRWPLGPRTEGERSPWAPPAE